MALDWLRGELLSGYEFKLNKYYHRFNNDGDVGDDFEEVGGGDDDDDVG